MPIPKKLRYAALLLSTEQFLNCYTTDITNLVVTKILSPNQVYNTLTNFGYCWNGIYWVLKKPEWFKLINPEKQP